MYERESGELRGVMKGMQQGVYSLDCHPCMSQVGRADSHRFDIACTCIFGTTFLIASFRNTDESGVR